MNKFKFKFDQPLRCCNLCKSSDIHHFMTDYKGISIGKCANCGILFMNPQYTDDDLEEFYRYQHKRAIKHHRYGYLKRPKEIIHEYNIKQIESYVSVGHFLSIGCGEGIDLEVARKRGWSVEGYEVNKYFIEKLSKHSHFKIRNGDFCQISYDHCHYDCVYLNHVLEHTKNPGEYLEKINTILKRKGVLYIACPNTDSFSNRLKKFLEKIKLRKKVGKYYDTDKHLFYFNPFNLKNVLEKYYSFEVLSIGNDINIKMHQRKAKVSFLDHFPYRSSFRLIAQKIAKAP